MIEIKDIRKSFGTVNVLNGVNARIDRSEVVAIVGASGAGKTTLLQIVGTLDKPDSGEVLFDGENIFKMKDKALCAFRNQNIGFVFQFHQLLPEFNCIENVSLPALIAGKSVKETEKKAAELLDFLGLSGRITHKPAQLSGGEKQRVAVARALINDPKVILADEPTGSLDSRNRIELQNLMFRLRDEFGHTIVIVTHDENLSSNSDRILHIKDGVIVNG